MSHTFEFLFMSLSYGICFLQPKPDHFIWNSEKKSLYKSLLNEKPVLSEGKTILKKMTQDKLSYESIETAVDSITKVLYKTATKCFTLKKHKIKKRKKTKHIKIKNGLIRNVKI